MDASKTSRIRVLYQRPAGIQVQEAVLVNTSGGIAVPSRNPSGGIYKNGLLHLDAGGSLVENANTRCFGGVHDAGSIFCAPVDESARDLFSLQLLIRCIF